MLNWVLPTLFQGFFLFCSESQKNRVSQNTVEPGSLILKGVRAEGSPPKVFSLVGAADIGP